MTPTRLLAALTLTLALALTPGGAADAAAPSATSLQRIAEAEDARRHSPGIREALSDRDPVVRARAALATGRLQDSTTVPELLPLLRDRQVRVRREAVFALGQIGHRSARATLELALADRDPQTRALAAEALGKLMDREATARLLPLLADRDPEMRRHVAVAMWRLADTTAVDALIARLTEPDASVRWRVVYALEKLPSPARIVPAVLPSLRDPDPRVRAHAARTLGRMRSRQASDALVGALSDAEPATVIQAIRALQMVADSSSIGAAPALARLLTNHADPHVRVTAATALADGFAWQSAPEAVAEQTRQALDAGLADRDAATRGACARSLLVRQGFRWWRPVSLAAEDASVYVRVAVLDGLRALPEHELRTLSSQVAGELDRAMAPGRPLLERMTAAEVLGGLAGRFPAAAYSERLPALRAGLQSDDLLMVAACAGALADARDSASVPLLERAFAARARDADADARISLRDALRALAGREHADELERVHPAPAPPATADPTATARGARLHLRDGTIEWRFYPEHAPRTVANFVTLARRGYFDGLVVHRVVPDFVIQDGDPTGTGSGGPGYSIRCEYNALRYEAGRVGMALSGKDTGGSQWFITLAPQPHLDGRYTIFAEVTSGLDVARRVVQGDRVIRVEILE